MQKMGKFLLLLSNVLHKCGTEYWDRTRKGAEGSIKGLFNLLWGLKLTYVSLFCIIILNPPLICLSLSLAQLEFVQILVIVMVMMVMVVVITCLLNHYRLSARSLLTRHTTERRRHQPLANVRHITSDASNSRRYFGNIGQIFNV